MNAAEVAGHIAEAARTLSRHRYGAIVLWNPSSDVEGGTLVDAIVSRELLLAIFAPEHLNGLRSGVTVIRGCRIERASVPMTWRYLVERAAGLAAGLAFTVDEDTGEVRRLDRHGRIRVVDAGAIGEELHHYALRTPLA